DDRPGRDQPLDDGGVVGRPPALEDARRAGGGHAPGAQVVLERDRHAGQRARVLAGGDALVDGERGLAGLVGGDEVEGVELAVAGGDGREVLLDDLDGRPGAGPDGRGDAERGVAGGDVGGAHGASPRTGGTRNWPSSAAGAAASTSSRSSDGRTSSGRITFRRG